MEQTKTSDTGIVSVTEDMDMSWTIHVSESSDGAYSFGSHCILPKGDYTMEWKKTFGTVPVWVMDDMDTFEVIYVCGDSDEAYRFGTQIHEQLVGNPDYIENRIILNIDGKTDDGRRCVRLLVGGDVGMVPTLDLKLKSE